jgi:hypothetical protein
VGQRSVRFSLMPVSAMKLRPLTAQSFYDKASDA